MDYRVTWEIDIEADSPRAAAQKALDIQRDSASRAVVFDVYDENGDQLLIDLDDEPVPCAKCGKLVEDWVIVDDLCGDCANKAETGKNIYEAKGN